VLLSPVGSAARRACPMKLGLRRNVHGAVFSFPGQPIGA
jgi:hypothetical protein